MDLDSDLINNFKFTLGAVRYTRNEITCIPTPLRYEFEHEGRTQCSVPPVAMYYFVRFMCLFEMKQQRAAKETLNDFYALVKDTPKPNRAVFQCTALNLLAQCFMMIRDFHTAKTILAKSVQLMQVLANKTALWILGVLYHQEY
jgi:hypothetical protein